MFGALRNSKITNQIAINSVTVEDAFWGRYMSLVRDNVIPYQWDALNDRIEGAAPSYWMHNFLVASGREKGEFGGCVFQDSDGYKWLEAVAYSLMSHPDEKLEKLADEAIEVIVAAQQEDGYLDTYYIINGLGKRFTNLRDNHELYCFGHMVEAAVAYYQATGKRSFMDAAIKYARCIYNEIGAEEGKKHGYPGHEIAEMALVRLYQITKEPEHLELASYFIDERGKEPLYFPKEGELHNNDFYWKDSYFQYQYYQAGKPVREQLEAEGHAVRAVYLYSGMADVARETGDNKLFKVCEALWEDITKKKMYITGAIGASEYGESFSFAYNLPNDLVYGETCAAIGLVFFAKRMFEVCKDSKYTDVMERALYNGIISGMALDGKSFFYVNPLEVLPEACENDIVKRHVKPERQKWFGCSCCPPNLARLISSLPNYAYTAEEDTLFMNLFLGGRIDTKVVERRIKLNISTDYPWDQSVDINVEEEIRGEFTIAVRIPSWCKGFRIEIGGKLADYTMKRGYAYIRRHWYKDTSIRIVFIMKVEMIMANPRVREDIGKVAVMRGPVVYCLEEADNGTNLHECILQDNPRFEIAKEDILGGIVTINARGKRLKENAWKDDSLYAIYEELQNKEVALKFIPYYAWANRGIGEMMVWVRK